MNEPGLIYDMPESEYHADPVAGGSLSSTFARLLTEHVPAKAKAIRDAGRTTKAMNLGSAAHALALGSGPELIVLEHDGRTKLGKEERAIAAAKCARDEAVIVTAEEREHLDGMMRVFRAEVGDLIGEHARTEVSAFWTERDTWLRGRIDLLRPTRAFDYKKTVDASAKGFRKSMGAYGYHQQADFYMRGLKALGHPAGARPMRFICQEIRPPYLIQIHEPDDWALDVARVLNDRAIDLYRQCTSSGTWPGFDALTAEPTSLPAWYFADHEDVLPDEFGLTSEITLENIE